MPPEIEQRKKRWSVLTPMFTVGQRFHASRFNFRFSRRDLIERFV